MGIKFACHSYYFIVNLSEITTAFSDKMNETNKPTTLSNRVLSRIYGNGRGWAFSKKDFTYLGNTASIDRILSRLADKGITRRVMRGLYDYPAYSKLLKKTLSPDIDQLAHALARKFGWQIQISGNAALNIVGLSTQVPTQYLYLSDGPSKVYEINNTEIRFKKTRFTQLGLKYTQSEILVQAVQALGDKTLSLDEQIQIRYYLAVSSGIKTVIESGEISELLIARILKDTQYVTNWIARNIRQILTVNY